MKFIIKTFFLLSLISCQKKKTSPSIVSDPNTYEITLFENQADSVLNRKFGISMASKLMDSIPSFLSDIPKSDTLSLRFSSFLSQRKLDKLYEGGLLDSIKYPNEELKRGIYFVNGYRNGKQFIVIDANNNYTFKDDTIFYYDLDFKNRLPKNPLLRDSIPFVDIIYDNYDGKGITKKQIKVKPLPEKLAYHEIFPEKVLKTIPKRQLEDIFDTKIFYQQDWEGILQLEEKKYQVNVLKVSLSARISFYEKNNDPILYDKNQQVYEIKDSVELGNYYYRIDSITPIYDKLFLRKLDIKAPTWGYRKGEKSFDFEFQNIDGEERKISDLLLNKEYVLIDFWGTWCVPCMQLTPDLVRMSKEYQDKIQLLSIAYDKKKEPLLKYIEKHKMKWQHIYLEGNAKSAKEDKPILVKNFAIQSYPTFLLINKQLEIVYRGTGRPGLEELEEIIKNK